MTQPTKPAHRHRVVIIGSGFGGLTAAKRLRRADVDVTLISKTTSHLFQPLLYQVATGILSEGEIAPTTRLVLRKQKNVRVLLGEVENIDLTARTVTSKLMTMETVVPFDSLIVAAGSQQSYFGNDQFATFAPGMKTIDDALELRGRILGAFEAAEVTTDPAERERRLTFVVVGGGPTGVELAGQIAELATRTLAGAFRTCRPTDCRVILVEGAGALIPPMGPKLGAQAQRRLEKMGVEIRFNSLVTDVDYMGVKVKHKEGGEERIECACKVWSAGVQASPLGKMVADQSDGSEIDRAGRVVVQPDLTVKGHPNVFVIGDLMSVPGVPGMAQGALQGAKYATNLIKGELAGRDDPADRAPFKYFDKGSMATVSRFSAVAQVGKFEFGGFIAWLAWLVLHLVYLVGFKNRFTTLITWFITFISHSRGQMAITSQMIYARLAMDILSGQQNLDLARSPLAAVEAAEKFERERGAS
ncbi:NAD(P)/FAD-dependent oxidoreductase [Mycobacterium sp. ITM-2016-00318]|uniref:NAD(P)/FAD-dependent oxidoreductase n=1 Tax=Mycobacterium sp. ITM-2016-00318 TaxID=2099693 RepID=UPI000CF9C260|nr:NAD(P)/FAD-dependent oxidoreductase [Mycobacterium sp. ITM-2016-00318]WNG95199.1 NAD(P)/FAD-dependent oxidoreductase [Mycobacterium sp. ITM-2016-00318]